MVDRAWTFKEAWVLANEFCREEKAGHAVKRWR